jgi:tRNA 2-thiocytidine biosynthesis protein TtcA
MFTALQNVAPSHLMDSKLFDFMGVKATGVEDDGGDKAFDAEEFVAPKLPGLQVVAA